MRLLNSPTVSGFSILHSSSSKPKAKEATELALKNNMQLMFVSNEFLPQEIEFPTSGLDSVPGDGEGGIEMTGSLQLIREFCDLDITPEKLTRTRIFFPEANEVTFARQSAFRGSSLKLDYLTKPSFFQDFGFETKVKMSDRVKPDDELFLVAYPYFNVNVIINNLKRLSGLFLSEIGCTFPITFPEDGDGILHSQLQETKSRCNPGPWKVLKKVRSKYICAHQQEMIPSLKKVALEILPSS